MLIWYCVQTINPSIFQMPNHDFSLISMNRSALPRSRAQVRHLSYAPTLNREQTELLENTTCAKVSHSWRLDNMRLVWESLESRWGLKDAGLPRSHSPESYGRWVLFIARIRHQRESQSAPFLQDGYVMNTSDRSPCPFRLSRLIDRAQRVSQGHGNMEKHL